MWNNEAAQLNSVPSGVVEKRVNKSCLTKAPSHYSCTFATIADVFFQDLPFARLSSSWNRASDFFEHVAVTLGSSGLCESHLQASFLSPFLPPSLRSGKGVNAAQITKCPDSQVWIIMSWPWAFLHRRSTSPPCQVAKVNTFVLLSRAQLRLQGGGGKKKGTRGWENRETQRQRAAEGWKRGEIRGARKRKGGGGFTHSQFHTFTSLWAKPHQSWAERKFKVQPNASRGGQIVRRASILSDLAQFYSLSACKVDLSSLTTQTFLRLSHQTTAIKHASRFQAWS